jgi:N-acetylmuramoyl-L-alanine amidase
MPARRRRTAATLVAVTALAVAAGASTGVHNIRSGETLSGIALQHGVSTRSLAAANGIADPNRIRAGQTLTIPGGGGGSGAGGGAARQPTVARGETVSHVAARYGVTARQIAAANGLPNVDRVRAGVTLAIPGGGTAGAPPAAGTPAPAAGSRYPARLAASPTRLAYIPRFEHWASVYGVPADLLMAMTWLESGWQNHRVSSVGAVGIGQLMPATVDWMRTVLIREPLDPHDPDDNIRMSARYLQWLLARYGGDARLALAGYYQGPEAVRRHGLYGETENYVKNVFAFRDRAFSR